MVVEGELVAEPSLLAEFIPCQSRGRRVHPHNIPCKENIPLERLEPEHLGYALIH